MVAVPSFRVGHTEIYVIQAASNTGPICHFPHCTNKIVGEPEATGAGKL